MGLICLGSGVQIPLGILIQPYLHKVLFKYGCIHQNTRIVAYRRYINDRIIKYRQFCFWNIAPITRVSSAQCSKAMTTHEHIVVIEVVNDVLEQLFSLLRWKLVGIDKDQAEQSAVVHCS